MSEQLFLQQLFIRNKKDFVHFPDKETAQHFIDGLFNLLFTDYEKFDNEADLSSQYDKLKATFSTLLYSILRDKDLVQEHVDTFFGSLPASYRTLMLDAEAVLQFDPAALSIEEVLVAYPGFYAIAVYRFAHQLQMQRIKILPRFFSEYAHSKTGIDIHPGATIGSSFFIDHGTGIVIGETTVIGNEVKIYQGVTLGALNVSKESASKKRHPTIQDSVVIYSGATILGGDTVIGRKSIVGGNVWLTYSIPDHSVVYHQSEIRVRDNNPFPEPLNFVI